MVHVSTFQVRRYECDLYSHVNNAIYLRYMQEAGARALSAAGQGPEQLAKEGCQAWPSFIEVEYLHPLRAGDRLEVQVQPVGLHADLFQQDFELHQVQEGALSGRGSIFSSLVETASFQSHPWPKALTAAFFPGGSPLDTTVPALEQPPMPPGVFQITRQVAWRDTNAAGQVDPAVLLALIEECGRQVIAAHGWPMERMLAEDFAILLRRNQLAYPVPARLDETLQILTWASGLRRATATRHYLIRRAEGGETIAQVNALGVWVRLSNGQPIRVPPVLVDDFAPNIAA